ncbi:ankyrin repeat protein, partial [Teladorsagia circumcincta]
VPTSDESARSSLLEGGSSEANVKKFNVDEKNHRDNAVKTTERLSDLLSKMGDRVAQSEQTMDSLIHSSSVLVQTHTEFESHAGHIKTGNKLLSKYERRELTDKILVAIALIFYFASGLVGMEVDTPPVKMEELVREYAELLRQSNDEAAKRMVTRVEGILEATDDSGRSTPHFAAVGGCLPILQLSISQDKWAANRPDEVGMGWTPLMIAASAGRVEIVRYLLSLTQVCFDNI